jgi:DNA-binding transcriptional regulator YdaS (Cro superfamily)
MDLATYRSTHGLTQSAVADLLVAAGYTTANQSLISQWERGELVISADWCVRLEMVTGGVCTRIANRPDLFGDVLGASKLNHKNARRQNAKAVERERAQEGRDRSSG